MTIVMADRPKLGELLLEAGVIDDEQLESALGQQRESGQRLGMSLVQMHLLDEETLVRTLARQLKLPVVWLRGRTVRADVLDLVPGEIAAKHRCLPVMLDRRGGSTLLLAMEDPADVGATEEVALRCGLPVKPVLAAPSELDDAIRRHYPPEGDGSCPLDEPTFVDDRSDGPPDLLSLPPEPAAGPSLAAPPLPPPPGASPAVAGEAILKALSQLLVEKGVITRDELVERVAALEDEPS